MLLFLNMSSFGIVLIAVIVIAVFIAIGNYGKNTAFGYWGSLLLAIFANPVVAFIVLYVVRQRYHNSRL